MDINKFKKVEGEKPLDNIVSNGGFCSVFDTIACIGDSLSSGEMECSDIGGHHTFTDIFNYSWGQFMARDAGIKVYNFSRGGMTAKEYIEDFARLKDYYNPKYIAKAYIIALGVNDGSAMMRDELEMGSLDDVCKEDWAKNKPTFAGYYAAIIQKYKEISPKSKFFLMTPPRTEMNEKDKSDKQQVEAYNKRHGEKGIYNRMREILIGLCSMFDNCYLLDFRKYAPVYDEDFRNNFYLGGHLNAAGYRLTALMVESYIDYIVRNNPGDFTQIALIGQGSHSNSCKW